MGFQLTRCNDLSLADLAQRRREGYPVARSAHAGNIYPANLATGHLNAAEIVLYDRVLGEKDRVSHPHLVVKGGRNERVSCDKRMAARGLIDRTSDFAPLRVQGGRVMAECHRDAVKAAFPDATVMTQTDYLSTNAELAWKVLEVVGRIAPHRFYRRIDKHGNITRKLARGQSLTWDEIKGDIFGFTNPVAGWLPDNVLNVLIYAVVESQRAGTNLVYHTSGVDMDGYIDEMVPDLVQLYQCIHDRGVASFAEVEFSLAVITPMRFCGDPQHAADIEQLFQLLKEYQRFESGVGRRIKSVDGPQKQEVIQTVTTERQAFRDGASELVAGLPGFMYRPDEATFYSQYDVLEGGLFVLEEAAATPLQDLAAMIKTMTRFLPRS